MAILEEAAEGEDPAVVLVVVQKAIASALKVIMGADDYAELSAMPAERCWIYIPR